MNLLIDATNLTGGGGVTHLHEMLNSTSDRIYDECEIKKIVIVGLPKVLAKINNHEIITKISMGSLEYSLIKRQLWKLRNFEKTIKDYQIDLIFNPGGSYISKKHPYITMCRNMLVFEKEESKRFKNFLYRKRFDVLRYLQTKSMKNAAGVIFISKYAENYIKSKLQIPIKESDVIFHGISEKFNNLVREQKDIGSYNDMQPFKILYISITNPYKHHANIAEAILNLKDKHNFPLQFIVVGDKGFAHDEFENVRRKTPETIIYRGKVDFEEIQKIYHEANLFVFGSTCENMPNILIEAMTSGLPIACSKKMPMPEFLKDGGIYFDSENVASIEKALAELILNKDLRSSLANIAKENTFAFSWEKCSQETFYFIKKCYDKSKN